MTLLSVECAPSAARTAKSTAAEGSEKPDTASEPEAPQTGNIAKGGAADTACEYQHPLLRCSRTGNPSSDTPPALRRGAMLVGEREGTREHGLKRRCGVNG